MKTLPNLADLQTQADELAATEVLTATNEGTWGPAEAARKVGTSDPRFANRSVYTRVGTGELREVGCDADRAPGRMRRFGRELAVKQAELADLRDMIRRSR